MADVTKEKDKEVNLTETKAATSSTNSKKESFEASSQDRKNLQPGQKQPAHRSGSDLLEEGVSRITEVTKTFESEAKKPHSERTGADNNPTPPHERNMANAGPAATAALDSVAQSTRNAIESLRNHEESEARIKSDPRWERDQKVFEMGRAGKLGAVPPAEEEIAAMASRAGVPEEVIEAMPKTPEEQAARDMERLRAAEEKTATGTTAAPSTGKTETSTTKPTKQTQETSEKPSPKPTSDTTTGKAATAATEKK